MSEVNASSQALAFLSSMHDFAKSQKKELETIGVGLYKSVLVNSANSIKAIIDTSGNSIANDMLVDEINNLIEEVYDDFPNSDEMCSIIKHIMKLFNIAVSKASQEDKILFKEGYLASIKSLSFQRKPQFIQYDPYMTNRKNNSNIIRYDDDRR